MSKFGLTESRYQQMMKDYGNDEAWVQEVVEEWGADLCNKGYDIFDFDGTGMLEINRIDAVNAFNDDEAAVEQAINDGVRLIPVDELPKRFDRKYLGWIDTSENRKRINEYTERCFG